MRQYPFIYSQRDPAWASQRLGTVNGATIGQYGCILTCQAMKAGYYGHEIKPNALDDIFTNRKLYVQGDLLPDVGIHQVFDDVQLVETKDYANSPTDLNYLKQIAGDPTLTATIEVDFDHNPNDGIQTHFIELHDFDGTNLTIYDPWYGTADNFTTHYGTDLKTTILKIATYKGSPTVISTTYKGLDLTNKDSMKVAVDVWAKLQSGDLIDKTKYDTDIKAKDATINNLNIQINKLNADISLAQTQVGTLNTQVLNLTKAQAVLQTKANLADDLKKQFDQANLDRQNALDAQSSMNKSLAQKDRRQQELINNAPKAFFAWLFSIFKK